MTAVAKWLSSGWGLRLARVVSLLAVVAITVYVFSIRNQSEYLATYGYPGIFLLSVLANATVILPAPGIAIVFAMAATGALSPIGIALAAGLGATVGEFSGYLAGFSGQVLLENTKVYEQVMRWMRSNGPLTIFLLAAIPNPLFDVAGIVAGAIRMPLAKFFFASLSGKILKMLFFAYAGLYSLEWVLRLMSG